MVEHCEHYQPRQSVVSPMCFHVFKCVYMLIQYLHWCLCEKTSSTQSKKCVVGAFAAFMSVYMPSTLSCHVWDCRGARQNIIGAGSMISLVIVIIIKWCWMFSLPAETALSCRHDAVELPLSVRKANQPNQSWMTSCLEEKKSMVCMKDWKTFCLYRNVILWSISFPCMGP